MLGDTRKERKPRRREIIITRERDDYKRGEREKEREREREGERGGGGEREGEREYKKRDEGVWKVKISEKNRQTKTGGGVGGQG